MNLSDTIKARTSLRVYDDRMISDSDLDQILEAAFLAPTAGNQQLYSIIVIKSQETKDKLVKSCDNQPFIAKAPVLLLFIADQQKWFDYYRSKGCQEFAEREEELSWEEPNESDLLLSIEDTMIAAQNAVLMAESLGIGSCYIGDILENYEYHRELFQLPKHAVPISLLCLGYYREGHKRVYRKRFDRKYVAFEEVYKKLSDEELEDMFAEKASGFVKGPAVTADNFAQAFYKRKTGAAFSREMARSVRAMLKSYTGTQEDEA
ncbi:MAG: nitroreductase family protein [Clostridium sp.]|jgi:FMN reductase (NADPH)|nr:nitroreductase family protein [Clostridium sp.]